MTPLRLAYLLDETSISGSARIALAQADALIDRGHQVRLVTKGLPLTWRNSRAEWVYVDDFREYDATGDFVVPAEVLTRFPIVDEEFFRSRLPRECDPPRVLLCGASQDEVNGVDDGYGAAAHARWFHQKLELIRASPWAPSREEPLEAVQEFHVGLTTIEMTRLAHACDILIAPNRSEERFGLTAAEALASALACVFTAIPSFLAFDEAHDYALFAPENNAVELGERLIELLGDARLRHRLRTRGREVAEQWRAEKVVPRLEAHLYEQRDEA